MLCNVAAVLASVGSDELVRLWRFAAGGLNELTNTAAMTASRSASANPPSPNSSVLIVCVVGSGAFLGITNTLMTQVVMESAPVPRPIASSAYSFVRFCGGAIAPFVAGKLAEHVSVQAPFYLGAGMTAIGVAVLFTYRDALTPIAATVSARDHATTIRPAHLAAGAAPMVLAVAGPTARRVSAIATPLARARGAAVHVLHVIETDVLAGEETAELENPLQAQALLDGCIAELREAGVPVTGELLHSYGTHKDVATQIPRRATDLDAGALGHASPTTAQH